ncbi:MAG: tetratricopeptide repeat protein [Thermodesulfovibrionales bacterium]|nr:tetratricopeptide repeat protein [Thermodesulfovibrionales bacterium]
MSVPQEYLDNTILIVDDELSMRVTINNMLSRMGFKNLHMAENGKRAFEIVQARKIDLIIADINMPIMSGIELFKTIKDNKNYQHIKFIFVTAEASRQIVARAAEDGGEAYIIKPFVMATLEEKIIKVLEKKYRPNELEKMMKNYNEFLEKKDYDAAEKELNKVKEIVGETAKILFNMAKLQYHKGDINKAIELYKEAINKNPMFVKAYNALGEIYESLGDIQSAIRYYEIAHEISPANTERLITLSKLLHKTGDTEKAASLLKGAIIETREDVSTSEYLLGEIYLSQNKNELALETFLKAHRKNPSDIHIMKSLAETYRKVGKTEHALDIYNRILTISKENADTYYEMGKTFLEMGQKQKAIECMKKAWELNPYSQQITADLRALARQDKFTL